MGEPDVGDEFAVHVIRILMVIAGLAATPVAARAQATAPIPEVAVAGRWIKLPLPAKHCALDEADETERAFSEMTRLDTLAEGRQVLMPFANCADVQAFRRQTIVNFGFGSYAVPLENGRPWVLPDEMTVEAFLGVVAERAPAKFDAAKAAPLFTQAPADESDDMIAGLFSTAPDASYVAIFQRVEPAKRKNKATIAAGMRATTVVAGAPLVITLVRFDGQDISVYDELLRAEQETVRALHEANPVPAPAHSAKRS